MNPIIQKGIQTKLTKSLLDLIILQLLENHPMHGYEIMVTIRKSFGIYFGPSTIYPLLNTIEKRNHIKSRWNMSSEKPRKIYMLTDDGKRILDYGENSLKAICRNIVKDNSQAQNGIHRDRQLIQEQPNPKNYY